MEDLNVIKNNFLNKEKYLASYACKSTDAIYLENERNIGEIRPSFFHDIDRIIYSLSYERFIDKTQVFSFSDNDHITKRIIHVQLVSKIARTISRALNLNEDLTEAIALGHDIGHSPIGHVGEHILDEIYTREKGLHFAHNVQSVRVFTDLDNHGKGSNLSIQVLDGFLCHNGEMINSEYHPNYKKTKKDFIREYNLCYKDLNNMKNIYPMTLEGCVVRISDLIGYLGRDYEDAVRVGLLSKDSLPNNVKKILGSTNREIVDTIVRDIIDNSYGLDYIKMSDKVFRAMKELMDFNYKNIYDKANSKEEIEILKLEFNYLYKTYINDLETNNTDSEIFTVFLKGMESKYIDNTDNSTKVIDFLSGMTDDYLIYCYKKRK